MRLYTHICVWTEVETKKSDVQLPVHCEGEQVLERTEYKWHQRPFHESHLTRECDTSHILSLSPTHCRDESTFTSTQLHSSHLK